MTSLLDKPLLNELVKQFKIDISRVHVGVYLPNLKMSITSCESNEGLIIKWWLLHFSDNSIDIEALQKLLDQINNKKEIPLSFQTCLYWCTQTALADYYTDFFYQHNMVNNGHHLIDNGKYTIIFSHDKHIYIQKSFRESYFKGGNEVIVCYWKLYIKVFPDDSLSVRYQWNKTPINIFTNNQLKLLGPALIGSIAAIAIVSKNRFS